MTEPTTALPATPFPAPRDVPPCNTPLPCEAPTSRSPQLLPAARDIPSCPVDSARVYSSHTTACDHLPHRSPLRRIHGEIS
jgi:hypothetical protein